MVCYISILSFFILIIALSFFRSVKIDIFSHKIHILYIEKSIDYIKPLSNDKKKEIHGDIILSVKLNRISTIKIKNPLS